MIIYSNQGLFKSFSDLTDAINSVSTKLYISCDSISKYENEQCVDIQFFISLPKGIRYFSWTLLLSALIVSLASVLK